MKPFYQSKKFIAAVAGVLVVVAGHYLGLSETEQAKLLAVIVAYMAAVMGADWGKEAKAIEAASAERIVRPELSEGSDDS